MFMDLNGGPLLGLPWRALFFMPWTRSLLLGFVDMKPGK